MSWRLTIAVLLGAGVAVADASTFSRGYDQGYERFARAPPRPILEEARTYIGYALAGTSAIPFSDVEIVKHVEFTLWRGVTGACCQAPGDFGACLAQRAVRDTGLQAQMTSAISDVTDAPDPIYLGAAAGALGRFAARAGRECACRSGPEEALASCDF